MFLCSWKNQCNKNEASQGTIDTPGSGKITPRTSDGISYLQLHQKPLSPTEERTWCNLKLDSLPLVVGTHCLFKTFLSVDTCIYHKSNLIFHSKAGSK